MKMKKFVSLLLSAVLLLTVAVPVYAAEECDVHIDKNYDMICDICSKTPDSEQTGVNMIAVVVNDILYLSTYFTGVKSFGSIDTPITYDENVLLPLEGYYNPDMDFEFVLFEPMDNVIVSTFAAHDSIKVDPDDPMLSIYYFQIIDPDANIADSLHVDFYDFYDVKMTDGSECTLNPIFFIDCSHEHIDDNYDTVCDICGGPVYYWGDMNCDGNITAADARIALRVSAKLEEATEYYLFVGDLDEDGRITASEARKILRVAARLDTFEDL